MPRPRSIEATVRRRVLAALGGVAVVLAAVIVGGCALMRSLGLSASDAAVEAAVEQLRATSGAQQIEVIAAVGWSDCSVVSLFAADRDLGVSMAMVKEGGEWRLGRRSSDEVGFDTDDVVGSREACVSIARSTGPLANGEPLSDEDSADPATAGN